MEAIELFLEFANKPMLVKDTVIIDGIQYWSKDFCIEFAEEYASQGMRDRYTKGMAQRL